MCFAIQVSVRASFSPDRDGEQTGVQFVCLVSGLTDPMVLPGDQRRIGTKTTKSCWRICGHQFSRLAVYLSRMNSVVTTKSKQSLAQYAALSPY